MAGTLSQEYSANTLQSHLNGTVSDRKPMPTASGSHRSPIQIQSADHHPLKQLTHEWVKLSEDFQTFLGDISYPFKMLVWGQPGQGKSTFCMKLADQIANNWCVLYVSGEEGLNSATLMDKQRRAIQPDNGKKCLFIPRLPYNEKEWKEVITKREKDQTVITFKTVLYDSVTKLNITPFYADATANTCKMPYFNEKVSHIFISHAHKDGSTYRGDGSWGHEVDIIVRCENGVAIIEKNRFATAIKGKTGSELKFY
jgi:predicted ATP-dependent serine protease